MKPVWPRPHPRPVNNDVSLRVLRQALWPRAGRQDACGGSEAVRAPGSPMVLGLDPDSGAGGPGPDSARGCSVISLHAPPGGAAAA